IWQESIIEGEWVVNNRENYKVPFVAKQGENYRFTVLKKTPVMDISGKWEITFDDDNSKGLGEFKQEGNYLTGTILTETGDHRFLEGTVQANKLYLSAFDGSHAYLYEGKIQPDSTLLGVWRSGTHYKTTWTARRSADFKLGDADSLTFLKPGYQQFEFAFKNPDGQTVSLNDPRYQSKVKIVQILGTWCPNCRDETEFLLDYRKNNPEVEFEVIGLAFERHRDPDKAREAIRRYKKFFNIEYEILLAGSSDKKEASAALPMLNQVLSFPTMIIIDQNNQVRRIHTGFSGPATSEYAPFKQEFDTFMRQLVEKKS
ncbi:MAG: TlpA disulfide reductase family protein, partial [Saprospiraceae bacterium]